MIIYWALKMQFHTLATSRYSVIFIHRIPIIMSIFPILQMMDLRPNQIMRFGQGITLIMTVRIHIQVCPNLKLRKMHL